MLIHDHILNLTASVQLEEVLNRASKVEGILNAWLEFIALVDLNNATVPGDEAVLSDIELDRNYVKITKNTFSDLKEKINAMNGKIKHQT